MRDSQLDEKHATDDEWRGRQRSEVDYAALRAEAARVLDAGFALALNADGDGAVRACVEIFAERGRMPAGSSISDAEYLAQGAKILPTAAETWAAGEMVLASESGWNRQLIRSDLPELVSGLVAKPTYERPVFFRSIGLGLEDMALANALHQLLEQGQ